MYDCTRCCGRCMYDVVQYVWSLCCDGCVYVFPDSSDDIPMDGCMYLWMDDDSMYDCTTECMY